MTASLSLKVAGLLSGALVAIEGLEVLSGDTLIPAGAVLAGAAAVIALAWRAGRELGRNETKMGMLEERLRELEHQAEKPKRRR